MNKELVIILDYGAQYSQVIARRIREKNVYCEVLPFHTSIQKIKDMNPKGIILSGGPQSVYEENAPVCNKEILEMGVPVLGICYGMHAMTKALGGKVSSADKKEYGLTEIQIFESKLFNNVGTSDWTEGTRNKTSVWMSHTDYVSELPQGFTTISVSDSCPNVAIAENSKQLYAVQFHPEVDHTIEGKQILSNFLFEICNMSGDWKMSDYVKSKVEDLKQTIGDGSVICGLSGGVDSSVAAVMAHQAIGKKLCCIFVDHGMMRKNEAKEVEDVFKKQFDMNLICVDASDRFLGKLKGVTDPEQKRKIIGGEFIKVFEEEAKKIGGADFLMQGTIYPDVIESGIGNAEVIKSHHNVGGLPDHVDFKEIVEPLRSLFKDEVRLAGTELDIPDFLVWRQPFPGPGLGVRIIGEITKEKVAILQEADAILREEIANAGLDRAINQYFAVLTDMRSVGVMGDGRTYDYTVALRAVTTNDFMTADWADIPRNVLIRISNRITNEVDHVNRIVYDITSKPPATIEWE